MWSTTVKRIFADLMNGNLEPHELVEERVITRTGEERIVAWHNSILRDATGRIVATLSSGNDITQSKRMEEEIRSLSRFPSENPNPVLRLDRQGIVLSANEASKPLLQDWGSGIGRVAPKSWRDLATDVFPPDKARTSTSSLTGSHTRSLLSQSWRRVTSTSMEETSPNARGRRKRCVAGRKSWLRFNQPSSTSLAARFTHTAPDHRRTRGATTGRPRWRNVPM